MPTKENNKPIWVSSAGGPPQLSKTVFGASIIGVVQLLAVVLIYLGYDISEQELTSVAYAIGHLIGAVVFAYGSIRKLIMKFK